ncbi:MAG: twin-arginine translocase TatA/TatE family subunit [Bacteroidetes bacterium]|nr:twin-arginine translocase TatA/TatE family subunit [Bacteroidota bacterium]
MFGNIGGWEILIIILLVVVFFGAKKIPELAQGLGKGIKEFRKAAKDIQEDISLEEKKIEDKKKE